MLHVTRFEEFKSDIIDQVKLNNYHNRKQNNVIKQRVKYYKFNTHKRKIYFKHRANKIN